MPTHIKLILKKYREVESIRQDTDLILRTCVKWNFVAYCQGGMTLIAWHNANETPGSLNFAFSKLKLRNDKDPSPGSYDFFMLEFLQLLIRLKLDDIYDINTIFYGELKLNMPKKHEGIFIEIDSQDLTRVQTIDRAPGLKFTLRQLDGIQIPEHIMKEDASILVRRLNGKNRFFVKTDLESFGLFPVVFNCVQQRSFEIFIPTIQKLDYVPHMDRIVADFNKHLKLLDLPYRYFVSGSVITDNLFSKPEDQTENQKKLDALKCFDEVVPDEFLCGLTFQVMDTPVRIPDYDGRLELFVAVRIISEGGLNPFNRNTLTHDDVVEDKDLKNQIKLFINKIENTKKPPSSNMFSLSAQNQMNHPPLARLLTRLEDCHDEKSIFFLKMISLKK